MKAVSKILKLLDGLVNIAAMILLSAMTVIVFYQVITRYVFNFSTTILQVFTLVFLVWFGILGIAIGFRDNLHIGIEMVYNHLPKFLRSICDALSSLLTIGVGVIFFVEGINFVKLSSLSSLPGTKFSSSFLYICIPVCGALMIIYGLRTFIKLFVTSSNGFNGKV